MDRQEAETIIKASPLANYVDELSRLFEPSIRLIAEPVSMDKLALGESHFGGDADLPLNFEWPEDATGPLSLIAQMNLSDCYRIMPESPLPSTGWLCFFYETTDQVWGFDPDDRHSWRVCYFNADSTSLQRHRISDGSKGTAFKPTRLLMRQDVTLPLPGDDFFPLPFDCDDDQDETYYELYEALTFQLDRNSHRLLGHPAMIQGEMRQECQLVSNRLYCGNEKGRSDPVAKEHLGGAKDWMLLLQVDSHEDGPGWMWGDAGMLYFWIRRQDLQSLEFNKSWMILQCG